jgi:hypothetical protein
VNGSAEERVERAFFVVKNPMHEREFAQGCGILVRIRDCLQGRSGAHCKQGRGCALTEERIVPESGGRKEWLKTVGLGTGCGVLAGGVALFGETWYTTTVPLGMMIASYLAVRQAKGKGFWQGFTASLFCALLGIAFYAGVRYEQILALFPGKERIQIVYWALSLFVPLQLVLGVIVTWFYSRTKEKIEEERRKAEAERQRKIEERKKARANRPKKKFKKKNKR